MKAKASSFALAACAFAPEATQFKFYSASDICRSISDSCTSRSTSWKVPVLSDLTEFLKDTALRKAAMKACGGVHAVEFARTTGNIYEVRFADLALQEDLRDADFKKAAAALTAKILSEAQSSANRLRGTPVHQSAPRQQQKKPEDDAAIWARVKSSRTEESSSLLVSKTSRRRQQWNYPAYLQSLAFTRKPRVSL